MSYPVEYRTCWETMKRWRSSLVPSPTLNAWMLLKIGWESQDTPHFLRRGAAFHLTPSTLVSTTSLLILLPLDHFPLVPLATTQRWRSQEWNQCQVSMSKAMAHRTPSTWPKIALVRRGTALVITKRVTAGLMETTVLQWQTQLQRGSFLLCSLCLPQSPLCHLYIPTSRLFPGRKEATRFTAVAVTIKATVRPSLPRTYW